MVAAGEVDDQQIPSGTPGHFFGGVHPGLAQCLCKGGLATAL
jgi:hypothetical protein